MRMRNLSIASACLALLAATAACGGDAAASASLVTDSAGVRIVQSEQPAWEDGEGWTVGDAPSLDIGVVEGDAAYQLNAVRSVDRLADGGILVADGGTQQVRLFGADGRHLRSMGREGGGPGEFRTLSWAGVGPADTVLAWDGREKRLTVFAPDGSLVRAVKAQGPDGAYPRVLGTLADGSVLSTGGMSMEFTMGEQRDSVRYHRFGADGGALGPVGRFAGMEAFVMELDGLMLQDEVVFGRNLLVRPAGNEVLAADNDRYEIRFLSPDGTLRRIVRRPHEPLRATPADVDAYFDARETDLHGLPSDQAASFRALRAKQREELPRRETFPAFSDARTDAEGNLWVEQYARPGDEQPRWDVFDPQGRWLGTVDTPPGLKIHDIGADWILGVQKDELDVEHVRMYPLRKPAR